MNTWIAGVLATASLAGSLVACSATDTSDDACRPAALSTAEHSPAVAESTEGGSGATPEPPTSSVLPSVVLPDGTRALDLEKLPPNLVATLTQEGVRVEAWQVPLPLDEVAEYFRDTLPGHCEFDGLEFRGENTGEDRTGAQYVEWSWTNWTSLSPPEEVENITIKATRDSPDGETTSVLIYVSKFGV